MFQKKKRRIPRNAYAKSLGNNAEESKGSLSSLHSSHKPIKE
jgi:hypothetical protein